MFAKLRHRSVQHIPRDPLRLDGTKRMNFLESTDFNARELGTIRQDIAK